MVIKNGNGKKQFVSTAVVANDVGVSKSTVLVWIKSDPPQLDAIRLPSGHYRVHVDELARFKKSLRTGNGG